MNERSGVVNIGIEGMMLSSAFAAFLVGGVVAQAIGPDEPSPIFGATRAHRRGRPRRDRHRDARVGPARLAVDHRSGPTRSSAGRSSTSSRSALTGYLNRLLVTPNPPPGAGHRSSRSRCPTALVDLPIIGWIIEAFFAQGPIAISVLFLVVFLQIWLFRSRWGLRTRAVGEHPKAAETVGIDVIQLRYRNVILGGIFAGLAGAYLTLEQSGSFQNGMTNGRGFIALAAMIFGRWTPIGAFGAALLFAASEALRVADQHHAHRPASSGDVVHAIPPEFYGALPYVVTIIVLVAARRAERRAGGRRQAVRARGPDLTRGSVSQDARRRAEPRSSTSRRDAAPSRSSTTRRSASCCAAAPRVAVVGASRPAGPPVAGRLPGYLLRAGHRRGPGHAATTRPSAASPAYPDLAAAVAATGPFDVVDVFRRSEDCARPRPRGGRGRRPRPLAPARDRELGGGPDRPRGRPGGRDGPLHSRSSCGACAR